MSASHPETIAARLNEIWQAWQEGHGGACVGKLIDVRRNAAEAGSAADVVEATALRALCLLEAGDVSEATRSARRASRMARTEGQAILPANIVLARCRRHCGRVALAARILSSLPQPPNPRLAFLWRWERALAGLLTPGSEPADALDPIPAIKHLLSVKSGEAFEAAAQHLATIVSPWAPFRDEAHTLLSALDFRRPITIAASSQHAGDLARWALGETAALPPELRGLIPHLAQSADSPAVFVLLSKGNVARRILAPGLYLAQALGQAPLALRAHRQDRLDTAAAVLALAGADGLNDSSFFQSVYGFPFVPALHDGTYRALIHRLRAHVGASAEIARHEARIKMVAQGPLALPDPRSSPDPGDAVLSLLARMQGGASAADVSRDLNLSLRTVQSLLRELAADGLCTVRKAGRNVSYTVEDTTFSEPTDWRRDKAVQP